MFTLRHFLWLSICTIMITIVLISFNKKRPSLNKVLTTAMIISILSELTKVFSVIELVPSTNSQMLLPYISLNHLPLHFCSIQIILIIVAKYMKDGNKKENLLAFMAPTCIYGAIFALAMPSIFNTTIKIEQAFTHPISYQFFIYHSMLIALGIMIVKSNEIKWQFKHLKNTLLLVYLMGFISIYLNSLFASPTYIDGKLVSVDFWTNFFFTYQNPLGIRINALWQWHLYLTIISILAFILISLFYLPLIKKNK